MDDREIWAAIEAADVESAEWRQGHEFAESVRVTVNIADEAWHGHSLASAAYIIASVQMGRPAVADAADQFRVVVSPTAKAIIHWPADLPKVARETVQVEFWRLIRQAVRSFDGLDTSLDRLTDAQEPEPGDDNT